MSFNKRLKNLRNERKLSLRDASKLIGVPESTYREWEYGRQIRGHEPYIKIARAFGISVSELFEDFTHEQNLLQVVERMKKDIDTIHAELKNLK